MQDFTAVRVNSMICCMWSHAIKSIGSISHVRWLTISVNNTLISSKFHTLTLGPSGHVIPSVPLSAAFSRFSQYLRSYYRNNPVLLDDKLSIALCSKFIKLALIVCEGGGYMRDHNADFLDSTLHGGIDEIYALKSPIDMESILTSNSHTVRVEGPLGIGKSTLCWELCRRWDTLKSLQRFKLVLQLKLRDMRI